MFEATYPLPSAIPASPSVSLKLEDSYNEDHQITLIPISPIENEDGFTHKPQRNVLTTPKPPNVNDKSSKGLVQLAVVASASAASTAFMRSNKQGSLIDQKLLIKILSNLEMIEKMVTDYGPVANLQSVQMPKYIVIEH
ncbi:hypothetical protein IFM89_006886 [Coptis chinensis]|uniref:Uncharacterized protein n=1 Tax=Coptis chinensis TaxID=261450 RepID=A0A835LD24_9MAGN|nr:hypothetical protein IFM89_006886 [Coptis chinensis]